MRLLRLIGCRIGAHDNGYAGVLLGRPLVRCERCGRVRPAARRALASELRD
jgi:hypothetical protein